MLPLQKKSPMKVTSITFLFREVEQLAFYQLLPNIAILEDFEWLSSGPVSKWACEDLCKTSHIKCIALVTRKIFRIIMSIDLITTLVTTVCYILLLLACKIEIRVKMQLFWQVVDDFRMWWTPACCGWVGITAKALNLLTKDILKERNFSGRYIFETGTVDEKKKLSRVSFHKKISFKMIANWPRFKCVIQKGLVQI